MAHTKRWRLKRASRVFLVRYYRLLKDERALRREGWDWFFVPEDQRKAASAAEENPDGQTSGQFSVFE
jgi:hypothetical protein